jgi:hypothetical protein
MILEANLKGVPGLECRTDAGEYVRRLGLKKKGPCLKKVWEVHTSTTQWACRNID